MNDQNPVIHNPKAKAAKPQGQLASLMQSRWGDDFGPAAGEINRSSSAPPTQLLMQNNNLEDFGNSDTSSFFQKVSKPGSAFTSSPSQPNWGLWGAPSLSPNRNGEQQNTLFAPNAASSATRNAPTWNAPSPLRSGTPLESTAASPLRRVFEPVPDFQSAAPSLIRPKSVNPSYRDALDSTNDDEIRMKALLNAALDSREDLFDGPIPRAASTPPSRLQFNNPKFSNSKEHQQDIAYAMQNLALNNEEYQTSTSRSRLQPGNRRDGTHTTLNPNFPEPSNVAFSRDYEMYQVRQRTGDVFEQESAFLTRPASAQGRFSGSPVTRYAAPPGFDNTESNMNGLDPAMAQALATLSAAGNLSQAQIQQIQMQLRYGSPGPGGDMSKNTGKNQIRSSSSPSRKDKNGRDQSPTSNGGSSPVRSALLEEFRSNKNRKYDLRDIVGYIVEFSGDQHGSRFIQQKLETATDEERQLVFEEIFPHVLELTTDVFGNYVIQKFFEHGSPEQKETLAINMEGQILNLSLQMYGCRVVQKAFEYVSAEQQSKLIKELEGNVLKCVKDQNGNHVIQKAIERVSPENIRFIIDAFYGQIYVLATHPYGCRVIQRIFEHCSEKEIEPLLGELHKYAMSLIQDQYGNYVIQHILEKGKPNDRAFVIGKVKGNILSMSKHKFASNVVEKCVSFGSSADRQEIFDEVITTKADGTTPLYTMMKDQFANYVVQKLLDLSSEPQRILLVTKIKPQLPSLKKYTYGKHLINKVEKYITQYKIE